MSDLITVDDYERRAREILPAPMWNALFGDLGAAGWATNTNNVEAFDRIRLRPRVLVDVTERRLATTALGTKISLPVITAPSGLHQRYHAEGELATARATARCGTIMGFSTGASYSFEEVAAVADGPVWFQLYFMRDRRVTERLVGRAEEAGHRAIVITVDTPGSQSRGREVAITRGTRGGYDILEEHRYARGWRPARRHCPRWPSASV